MACCRTGSSSRDGKIKNYQCRASTWNAAPRNEKDAPGAYEACLVGNPIADPEKLPRCCAPCIRSTCIACAIHVMDEEHTEIVKGQGRVSGALTCMQGCLPLLARDPRSRAVFASTTRNRGPVFP